MSLIVVGSLNLDLVAEVARLPGRGETLLADGHGRMLGGKGANQAVSAARHGVDVAMVGCVGDDADGRRLTDALADEGIDVTGVRERGDAATGTAHITVDPEGANTIVVIPGANGRLSAADVRRELGRLPAPGVVLVQLEIPLDAVMEAVAGDDGASRPEPGAGADAAGRAAPPCRRTGPERARARRADGGDAAADARRRRRARRTFADGRAVVVTMGEPARSSSTATETTHVPAPRVDAVDTTGAGDAFCGSLAAGLARGRSLVDAARDAVRVASRSTLRRGALEALPTPARSAPCRRGAAAAPP